MFSNTERVCAFLMTMSVHMCPNRQQHSSRNLVGMWSITFRTALDVAPSDFRAYPALKKHLGGKKFSSDEEVQEEMVPYLHDAVENWYDTEIQKFVVRIRKVIKRKGDYIKKSLGFKLSNDMYKVVNKRHWLC